MKVQFATGKGSKKIISLDASCAPKDTLLHTDNRWASSLLPE